MQSKAVKLIYVNSVMLSIVCGGGDQISISPRATKGLEPALHVLNRLGIQENVMRLHFDFVSLYPVKVVLCWKPVLVPLSWQPVPLSWQPVPLSLSSLKNDPWVLLTSSLDARTKCYLRTVDHFS